MELRRAASGLVKVICRTEESRPGGRGRKPGKPKKKGLLARFEEWFGSINMMNILLAPTGLTRDDIWRHLFLTKQRKNPYEEGCYTGSGGCQTEMGSQERVLLAVQKGWQPPSLH